ncbi:MAG TPA: DUF4190 domain-containing protein [Phycisphaerae bacterium]|nr:DUF4190 domain-containing protein [Phycisphaerae bacterium]
MSPGGVACGSPVWVPEPPPPGVSAARTSGHAIAALIVGLCGLFVFKPFLAIIAIALGIRARRDIARNPHLGGWGLATAGIVAGAIELVFVLVALLACA